MRLLRNLYLTTRFFLATGLVIVLFIFSFSFPVIYLLAHGSLIALIAFTVFDIAILFHKKAPVVATRKTPQVLSLGDENTITIELKSSYNFAVLARIIDEIPEEMQERDFSIHTRLSAWQNNLIVKYSLVPKSRGMYLFDDINVFVSSPIRLGERRIITGKSANIAVYPSVIQMKNFELRAVTSISHFQGIKRIRKIGHSYEFDQIKQYVPGDDTRSINWKASSRATQMMVNQYDDERSQPVYCLIDKSRPMRMPFNGLSLLDYSINTSLVISNIVLRKHDRAGLLTFSDKLGSFIKAEKNSRQLNNIIQHLYNEKVSWPEADYELLYSAARNFIKGRSLLFLFCNFESSYALERVLPILRKLNKLHLLVVLFFEDTELTGFSRQKCNDLLDIYQQTAAKEIIQQKDIIQQILQMHGIQSIRTKPEDLSLNSVNKYLELKARGFI